MNSVFSSLPVSVFEVMSRLAREQGRGQPRSGISGRSVPAGRAGEGGRGGRARLEPVPADDGLPELRKSVAAHYKHWQDLDFDPESEIMITSGATEAIAGALMALIEPGDEVVLFQPLYDAYLPLVQRAGGVPRFVKLEPPHWRFR
jgi:aspartate/methionine/tyrosine aminotransferase